MCRFLYSALVNAVARIKSAIIKSARAANALNGARVLFDAGPRGEPGTLAAHHVAEARDRAGNDAAVRGGRVFHIQHHGDGGEHLRDGQHPDGRDDARQQPARLGQLVRQLRHLLHFRRQVPAIVFALLLVLRVLLQDAAPAALALRQVCEIHYYYFNPAPVAVFPTQRRYSNDQQGALRIFIALIACFCRAL